MPETEPVERSLGETLEEVRGMLVRSRWWIAVPAFFIALGTIGVAMILPNLYKSEATLVVVQQQVSQRYVNSDATQINETVNLVTRNVLSRGKLLQIIDEFHLYPKQKKTLTTDDLAELMRKDVQIVPLDSSAKDLTAFQIAFAAETPELAQAVTSRLTSLFIEENLSTQGQKAETTTSFLTERLEEAKKKVSEQEERLREFKARNAGQLPDQQALNLSRLAELRSQLQTSEAALNRAQERQGTLESTLRERISRLQSEKSALLVRFTPQYPEVIKKEAEIAGAEALIRHINGAPASATPASGEDTTLSQIRIQADTNALEVENAQNEQRRLRAEIAQFQGRLNLTPVVQQELEGITRDYNLAAGNYTDLLSKQQQSQLTTSLEENQQGQQFRMVDPPTRPMIPTSPKRMRIALGGVGGGIAFGLLLALIVSMKDTSFHSEKALKHHFPFPLVMGIPMLLTQSEERSLRRRKSLEWAVAVIMVGAVGVAEFFVYRRG